MDTNRKENLMNLLLSLLYWIICAAGTAAGIFVYAVGNRPTGIHVSAGLLADEVIDINPFCAVTGILLASACITAVWFCLMRPNLERLFGQHWGWLAAWILIFAAGAFFHFMWVLFMFFWCLGFLVTVRPEWTGWILTVPMFLPVLYLVGFLLKRLIRRLSARNQEGF